MHAVSVINACMHAHISGMHGPLWGLGILKYSTWYSVLQQYHPTMWWKNEFKWRKLLIAVAFLRNIFSLLPHYGVAGRM